MSSSKTYVTEPQNAVGRVRKSVGTSKAGKVHQLAPMTGTDKPSAPAAAKGDQARTNLTAETVVAAIVPHGASVDQATLELVVPGATFKPPTGSRLAGFLSSDDTAVQFIGSGGGVFLSKQIAAREFGSLQQKARKILQRGPTAKQTPTQRVENSTAAMALSQHDQPSASRDNATGMPHHLKSGIEGLSDISMDDVRVHYNSSRPAQLNAYAYAQGSEIHLAPGQERHLPHEAWHLVQQAQGRVAPTLQMKNGVAVNDDKGLEREADIMGQRAVTNGHSGPPLKSPREETAFAPHRRQLLGGNQVAIQRVTYTTMENMWNDIVYRQDWWKKQSAINSLYATLLMTIQSDLVTENYALAAEQLGKVDFVHIDGKQPEVDPARKTESGRIAIVLDKSNPMAWDIKFFCAAIVHELLHVANLAYANSGAPANPKGGQKSDYLNLHLPSSDPERQIFFDRQFLVLRSNWIKLDELLNADKDNKLIADKQFDHLEWRIGYGSTDPTLENDTVLFDLVFYMSAYGVEDTKTFAFAEKMLKECTERRKQPGKEAEKLTSD